MVECSGSAQGCCQWFVAAGGDFEHLLEFGRAVVNDAGSFMEKEKGGRDGQVD